MYGMIYKITNTINNKCYIGQTIVGVRKRYQISDKIELNYGIYLYHKKANDRNDPHCNKYLLQELEKYGYKNFKVEENIDIVIKENKTKEELRDELDMKEKYWIKHYKSTDPKYGYNKSFGGRGGDKINSGCIKVVCLNNRKVFPSLTIAAEYAGIETYDCINECCKDNANYGGKLKNGEYAVWVYYEDYLNMTEEDITNKISKVGSQQRNKINSRKVICLNNGKIYNSIRQCAKQFNINHGRISECCKGDKEYIIINNIKYKFKYLEQINN